MEIKNRKAQLVLFIIIVVVLLILILIINKIINYANRPIEKLQNQNIEKENLTLNILGDYLTYIDINEKYVDDGAKAYMNGQDISDDIIVSYYKNGRQVSFIDTRMVGEYIVRYDVRSGKDTKMITRVVLVTDGEEPHLIVPDTVTITSDEVFNYDVESGVIATDNSGNVSFECENTLSNVPKNYIIKCVASDSNGNMTSRNRLIKVIDGIEFEFTDKLTIKYPINKNYTYMYSLDNGVSFKEASSKEVIDIEKGNVIALVLESNKYVMASTYYIK